MENTCDDKVVFHTHGDNDEVDIYDVNGMENENDDGIDVVEVECMEDDAYNDDMVLGADHSISCWDLAYSIFLCLLVI